MRRTTIGLPEDLADRLEHEARRRNTSVSAIVRVALTAHFGLNLDQPRTLPFAKLGRSGRRHVAARMDDALATEWAPDAEADAFGRDR